MKLIKQMEVILMAAFFLNVAIGALQVGAPRKAVTVMNTGTYGATLPDGGREPAGDRIQVSDIEPAGDNAPGRDTGGAAARTDAPAAMPVPVLTPMPVLTPPPTPMPVIHVIGRRMTSEEKRAAASAG